MPLKPRRTDEQTQFARQLRATSPIPERMLWNVPRNRQVADYDSVVRFQAVLTNAPTPIPQTNHGTSSNTSQFQIGCHSPDDRGSGGP